ncbi:MAG: ABC transporter permease [Prevotellaceae bacterium]|jgi:phospholipid/cholesterol/gamma-HCH transport system permease protein|nr:ABC transporter permease [Prevotellaceae bacterium]
MRRVFSKPQRWRIFYSQVLDEMMGLGISSLAIVAIVSIFVGAVIAIQTSLNLMSAPYYMVGLATRDSLILEFCSTMIALILAGKIGSNIASQIGSMRITEQIDALELMGLNSACYLILPKILAMVVLVPFITIFSIALGIFGGLLGMALTDYLTVDEYIEGIQYDFTPYYVTYSTIKSMVFAFIFVSVSAFWGYDVRHGTLEVGRNSTRAVVTSCICILIFNLLLTELLL